MKRESSVFMVSVTSGGRAGRTDASLAFTASVTLMVFSPEARRMSSCTAGLPSCMNIEVATF